MLIAGLGHDAVFRVYDGLPDRRQRLNDELSVMRFACWLRQRGMALARAFRGWAKRACGRWPFITAGVKRNFTKGAPYRGDGAALPLLSR